MCRHISLLSRCTMAKMFCTPMQQLSKSILQIQTKITVLWLLTKPNAPDNEKDMYILLILFIYFLYKFSENETKPIFSSMERKTISFCSIPLLSSSFLLRYIRYTYTFQNHILKYIIMITIMNYSVEVHYGLLHLILKFIFINSAKKQAHSSF